MITHRVISEFRPLLLATVALLPLLAGCGRTNKKLNVKTFEVRGKVLLDGKPAGGAAVMLLPAELKDKDPNTPPAYLVGGLANEAGEFHLVTNGVKPGAPEGKYLVALTWPDPRFEPDREGGERGLDLMPPQYRDPRTSGLEYEVRSDRKEQTPLQLELNLNRRLAN